MKRLDKANINTPDHWDKFYAQDRPWNPGGIIKTMQRFIRPGQSVLDVGIGCAVIFRHLVELVPDAVFMGCDFSPRAIEKLQMNGNGLKFDRLFVHDIRELMDGPIADIVIATELLEHLEDPEAALRNIVRLARRRVIITVPLEGHIPDPTHLWEFTMNDLRNLLSPYGNPFVKHVRRGLHIFGEVKIRPSSRPK